MEEVDVIIEIAKGGHIKYEYDKEKNIIVCDRILHTPMKYPFNYGFIPQMFNSSTIVALAGNVWWLGEVPPCRMLKFSTKACGGILPNHCYKPFFSVWLNFKIK